MSLLGLYTEEKLRELAIEYGVDYEELKSRRTGKSTRIAFETFAECYRAPGRWVAIKDHFGTRESDRHLLREMRRMAEALGYEFEFSLSRNAIRLPKASG